MRIELPEPHTNQERILESRARFQVIMCGRRFGKSELATIKMITLGLQGLSIGYITPTYLLAKMFFDAITGSLPFQGNWADRKITFPNGGSAKFFTGNKLDNLRGQKFHFMIIDEASFIPGLEEGWLNSIRPTLTDYAGGAMFLSTPRGKNYFSSLYYKAHNGEADWQAFKFTTYDNPHIDPAEIDDARRQLPASVFEQEYLANPAENTANPFGSAYIKQCTFPISQEKPACYGIDLAKSVDWSVIIGLDRNGSVCYLDRFQKDWRQTKQAILSLPRAPILLDSTGVGDPIFEDLQREGLAVTGFKFSSSSKQQLMEGLASAIQQRKITFPEGVITEELEVFEYQYSATGVKYSAHSGYHDDAVMSLALAWSHLSRNVGRGRYNFG